MDQGVECVFWGLLRSIISIKEYCIRGDDLALYVGLAAKILQATIVLEYCV